MTPLTVNIQTKPLNALELNKSAGQKSDSIVRLVYKALTIKLLSCKGASTMMGLFEEFNLTV